MAGGWASALGAAILNANQGHSERVQRAFENKRQLGADSRAEQQLVDERKLNALHASILNDQNQELEKGHTESDITRMLAMLGPSTAMDSPDFVAKNKFVGTPLPQLAGGGLDVRRQQVKQVEGGPVGPAAPVRSIDSIEQIGSQLGVAPHTGVIIPPEVQAQTAERQLALTKAGAMNRWLSADQPPGQQPAAAGAAPDDMPEPPVYDPKAIQEWQRAKTLGLPEPPLQESAQHKLWLQQKELVNKQNTPPPSAATQREREAYEKIKTMIPELRQALLTQVADPNDPTGQEALKSAGGWASMVGQRVKQGFKAAAYNNGFPLPEMDSKIQQLAGLMKVTGSMPFMNGSRGQQLFNEASQHLLNRSGTPESMVQRLDEIASVYPEFEKALYHGGAQPPTPPYWPGDGPKGATAPAPAAAPQQANPQQSIGGQLKAGDTIAFADIVSRTRGSNVNPNTLAAQLMKEGVRVTK